MSHPPAQLTRDETRILEECERESLIYRSIPLGLCTYFGTQYAMSKNLISTKAKWIKIGGALFAGYIIGKVSYTPACRRKILAQIPDSSLAQMIRSGEAPQISQADVNTHQQRQTNELNHPETFVPDIDPVPVGVNQYGYPIYTTNK